MDSDMDLEITPENIHGLFRRYVGQLLQGCGHLDCREPFCHTGRLNSTAGPVRPYNDRSARAMALTICSGPLLRRHVCQHFGLPDETPTRSMPAGDPPLDPSSVVQQLCDTPVVRAFDHSYGPLSPDLAKTTRLNLALDRELGKPESLAMFRAGPAANVQIVQILRPHVEYLLEKIPHKRLAPLDYVDREFIAKGLAVPSSHSNTPADGSFNNWLVILDAVAHEPRLRLLSRIVKLVALRDRFEEEFRDKNGSPSDGPHEYNVHALVTVLCTGEDPLARVSALTLWLKSLFLHNYHGELLLERGTVCSDVLATMKCLCDRLEASHLPRFGFGLPVVSSRIDAIELVQAYLNAPPDPDASPLLSFKFLFDASDLMTYFRVMNYLRMRKAYSDSEKEHMMLTKDVARPMAWSSMVFRPKEHYLVLKISRDTVLKDTFDQLWQRRRWELARPLRVRLGELDATDIGHDLGGVQIEFFNLFWRSALSEEAQMFTTDLLTGYNYYHPGSLQPLHMFEMCGLMFALAIYNGTTLPVVFPAEFYSGLYREPPPSSAKHAIDGIEDGWPTIARSMRAFLHEAIDLEGMEFTYGLEANGVRLDIVMQAADGDPHPVGGCWRISSMTPVDDHSGPSMANGEYQAGSKLSVADLPSHWPGHQFVHQSSEAMPVTRANKDEYIKTYCRWLTHGSVAPQLEAFRKGFHDSGLFDERTLAFCSALELKRIVEGENKLDINQLKAATKYDGYSPTCAYIRHFWRIVSGWDEQRQRELVKFVTAAERFPLGGAGNLEFIIKRNFASLDSLPMSSTCFGTLYLPKYPDPKTLAQKLNQAVQYGNEGFGTG